MKIMPATIDDAREILALQHLAYQTEAAIYDDDTLPPLLDKLEDIAARFENRQFLKAIESDRIIGSVRAWQDGETCFVERLIVHPDCRCRGVGTALLHEIEPRFSDVRRFELFTGHKSESNIRLYERIGYRIYRQERVSQKVTLVFMEKAVPMKFDLEPMTEAHGRAVVDIFNHFILQSFAAYPDEPLPYEFFDQFQQMTQGYPALVATADPARVVGFGFLKPFHFARTLRRTAEVTYFISPDSARHGIGTAMLNRLIEEAVPMNIDSLVASISSKNEESIAFHRKNGFRECGRFERAGRKNDQDFDIVWMQRHVG